MTLKVAIVGCGAIADGHVEAIKRLEGARLVAACDREPMMAEQLAVRFGIDNVCDDYERMLDEHQPDVVHITTPPQSHLDLGAKAIERGCHVYMEKPLTMNRHDARALIAAARERGVRLTVGHIYQFEPPALAVRKLVAAGVVGEPVHLESFFGYNLAGSFGRAIMGSPNHWVHGLRGNLPHNNLSHPLSKVLEFMPDEEPDIHAMAWKASRETYGDVRDAVYDELRATIKGATVSAYVTFSAAARPQGHSLRVYGTRNTLHADYVARTVTLERAPRLPGSLGRLGPAFSQSWQHFREGGRNVFRFARNRFHFFAGMHELVRRFYASIEDGTEPPIPYDEIARVSDAIDRIFEQLGSRS